MLVKKSRLIAILKIGPSRQKVRLRIPAKLRHRVAQRNPKVRVETGLLCFVPGTRQEASFPGRFEGVPRKLHAGVSFLGTGALRSLRRR